MNNYPAVWKALLLLCFLTVGSFSTTQDDDLVDMEIVGYNHKFFSGYFDITSTKSIHYVFFHSQNDISGDPLVIWFSGGPGCSSLIACFHENGPFIFHPEKLQPQLNQHSWNTKANVLYLQLPANVGFSVGPDEPMTDELFTVDAVSTIRLFFTRFPTFKKNQMYLTGHGYAGVYVAHLARYIIYENSDPYVLYNDHFNLKGIMVGNPCVRPDQCYSSGSERQSYYHYQFLYHRAYYTKKTWEEFQAKCLLDYGGYDCYLKRIEMDKQFNGTNSSIYNIYNKCYKGKNNSNLDYINSGCEDDANILTYINNPINKKAWNIVGDKDWAPCNTEIYVKYLPGNNSYWIYPYLIQNKLRIWVYSGDVDSYIPIIGTKRWVEELRHQLEMPVKRIWREWWVPGKHKGEDQVGGFIWELRDLTLVTVKGAGFTSATDKPKAMAEVLAGFLAGKPLPYKNE